MEKGRVNLRVWKSSGRYGLYGLALALAVVAHSFAQSGTNPNQCTQSAVGGVPAAGSTALGYLASIIPTPGLTSCSVCGTTGVRCAADASKSIAGQGEGLNQAVTRSPKPRASYTATGIQVYYTHSPTAEPSMSSLSQGQSVNGYVNNLCTSAPSSPSSASIAKVLGPRAAGEASGPIAILGSQDTAIALLSNLNQVVAWINENENFVYTGVRSADGSSFTAGAQYASGPSPENVIAADFNNDGIADLAVSNSGNLSDGSGGNIQIFLGKGDGTFTSGAKLTIPTPTPLHAGDLNGDGKVDLVAADQGDSNVQVFLGNGDGTFRSGVAYPLGGVGLSVVTYDFNGDGKLDVAAATTKGIAVLLGNGDGTLKAAVTYSGGKGNPQFLAAADFNNDGKADLLAATPDANAVSFLFGNGDGTFQAPVQYLAGAEAQDFGVAIASDGAVIVSEDLISGARVITPVTSAGVAAGAQLYPVPQAASGIAVGDLNGDKLPDMIAADGAISVLVRNPAGGFKPAVNYTLNSGSKAAAIAVGDMNGDGKNDVVSASVSTNSNGQIGGTVDVALGNGDGTLGGQTSYAIGGYTGGSFGSIPSGMGLADFNGDGKLDVVAGFQSSPSGTNLGGVSVLLGNGDGTLKPAVTYGSSSTSSVFSVAIGDFNKDGKLDIAAGTGTDYFDGGQLMILLGKGDGTFQSPVLTKAGSPAGVPIALATGDVNGDGIADLVMASATPASEASVVVLLGNGDGSFRQSAQIATAAGGSAIALVDLNGDGRLDVVVGDCCGYSESVYLLGKGDGTFQAPQYFASGSSATAFAVTSWNNDGVPGLAVAHQVGTVAAVVSGLNSKTTGAGEGATAQVVSAAGGVPALAPGSLTTAYGADLANGAPDATSLPWPDADEGTSVLITDSTGARTPAPVTYVSQTQVNFQIPDSVHTGAATIAVTSGDGAVSSAQATLATFAPALFTLNAANLAAAVAVCVSSSGAQTTEYPYQVVNGAVVAQPLNLSACSQTILLLYGTGFDTANAAGVQVTIGGVSAPAAYAGPQGTWPGLDQINVTIPQSLAGKGSVAVTVGVGGQTSNAVNLTVQ